MQTLTFIGYDNTCSASTMRWNTVKSSDPYAFEHIDSAVKYYTPHFAELKAKGVLPVTPYERTIADGSSCCEVMVSARQLGPKGELSSMYENLHMYQQAIPLTTTVTSLFAAQKAVAQNEAKARFATHIENVKVQTITEVGEAHESLVMIYNVLKLMNIHTVKHLVKNEKLIRTAKANIRIYAKQPWRLGKIASDLNNMYLEYNYGWRPLYSTFCNAVDIWSGKAGRPRTKVSGKSIFADHKDVVTAWSNTGSSQGAGQLRIINTTDYKYSVWVGGLLNKAYGTDLHSMLGMNANEVVPSLWDLVKYSFVLDYFTNISDVIANMKQSLQRMDPSTLYMSEKIEYILTTQLNDWKPFSGGGGYTYPGYARMLNPKTYRLVYFKRTPMTGSGCYVTFNFKDPSWASIAKILSLTFARIKSIR